MLNSYKGLTRVFDIENNRQSEIQSWKALLDLVGVTKVRNIAKRKSGNFGYMRHIQLGDTTVNVKIGYSCAEVLQRLRLLGWLHLQWAWAPVHSLVILGFYKRSALSSSLLGVLSFP